MFLTIEYWLNKFSLEMVEEKKKLTETEIEKHLHNEK